MAGIKSTKAEKAERLAYTAKLLGEGKYRYEIVEELTALYNICDSSVDKYIAEVYEDIKANSKDLSEHLLVQYDELLRDLMNQETLTTADRTLIKQIIDSKAKMTVLREKKIDITSNGESLSYVINFTPITPTELKEDGEEEKEA